MKRLRCFQCGRFMKKGVFSEPERHLTSPGSINRWTKRKKDYYLESFCRQECIKKLNKRRNRFFAELDRNVSDSTCFLHDHWETDSLHRRIRVGRCQITNKVVRVEPLQLGDDSGQPKECYEHFQLRV